MSSFKTNPHLLKEILEQARKGDLQLPDFQRSWVWNENGIKELLISVLKGFPIGSLMTLEVGGSVKFRPRPLEGVVLPSLNKQPAELILDGQQRTTSLFLSLFNDQPVPTRTDKEDEVKVWGPLKTTHNLEKHDRIRTMKQHGFFDENDRLNRLSELGDTLEKLNKYINWEQFRGILTRTLQKEAAGPGGRPPFDYVMMFKILILQKLYNISDDQTEYQINDRLSFMRFLGLALCDKVPDAKTIWHFREELTKASILDTIFYRFVQQLEAKGIISYSGSIIDATFVDAPKQRNSREENKEIKEGKTPEAWEQNKHKKVQKDVDARWRTKNKERHFGYKDHVKIDKKSKLIIKYRTTSAEVHDSQELKNLIEPEKDKRIYADSAYTGKEVQSCIPETMLNRIHEKGYRNRPLSKTQKRNNTTKSHIRARVEHVFGAMTSMGGIYIRSIGKIRAQVQIGLINLTYNIKRYAYLMEAKAYA
jgi:IS5 family transposase